MDNRLGLPMDTTTDLLRILACEWVLGLKDPDHISEIERIASGFLADETSRKGVLQADGCYADPSG